MRELGQEPISMNFAVKRLRGLTFFLENHLLFCLMFLFLLSLIVRLLVTPFNIVLREDAYVYLKKALEITRGNFIPSLSQPIGWSLFMAPFLRILHFNSLLENMAVARILSVLVGSLILFPLYLIGKDLLKKRELIFLMIFFTFSSQLILSATSAMTEPLFMLLFFISVYFIYRSVNNQKYILLASLFAGLAYYVRSNGIFLLAIIVLSHFFLQKDKSKYRYILYTVVIFFLTSAPFLIQRYFLFGSPTFFGPNSKFFVDDYQKVWCNNIPVPSLLDYLRTHGVSEWINKFVIHGFFELVFLDFIYHILTALLTLPFIYGVLRYSRKRELLPLNVAMIVWIVGLTPVWDLFDNPRHLFPLIPIVLIFTSIAIYDMFEKHTCCSLLKFLFLIVFISFSLINPVRNRINSADSFEVDGLHWAQWIAEHLKGKIAIMEGGDLIMMQFPDTVVGGVGQYDLYAPVSNVSIVRPGCFDNLDSAMKWFKEIDVDYLVADNQSSFKRPYLERLYLQKEPPPYLEEIYSNVYTTSKWKVRIYKINWEKYCKSEITGKNQ